MPPCVARDSLPAPPAVHCLLALGHLFGKDHVLNLSKEQLTGEEMFKVQQLQVVVMLTVAHHPLPRPYLRPPLVNRPVYQKRVRVPLRAENEALSACTWRILDLVAFYLPP